MGKSNSFGVWVITASLETVAAGLFQSIWIPFRAATTSPMTVIAKAPKPPPPIPWIAFRSDNCISSLLMIVVLHAVAVLPRRQRRTRPAVTTFYK